MAGKKKSNTTTTRDSNISKENSEMQSDNSRSRGVNSDQDLNTDTGVVDRGANTDRSRNVNKDQNVSENVSEDADVDSDSDTDTDLNR